MNEKRGEGGEGGEEGRRGRGEEGEGGEEGERGGGGEGERGGGGEGRRGRGEEGERRHSSMSATHLHSHNLSCHVTVLAIHLPLFYVHYYPEILSMKFLGNGENN